MSFIEKRLTFLMEVSYSKFRGRARQLFLVDADLIGPQGQILLWQFSRARDLYKSFGKTSRPGSCGRPECRSLDLQSTQNHIALRSLLVYTYIYIDMNINFNINIYVYIYIHAYRFCVGIVEGHDIRYFGRSKDLSSGLAPRYHEASSS